MKNKWRLYTSQSLDMYYSITNIEMNFNWDNYSNQLEPYFNHDFEYTGNLDQEKCIIRITFDDDDIPCEFCVLHDEMPHKVTGWKEITDYLDENDFTYEPLWDYYEDEGFDTLEELESALTEEIKERARQDAFYYIEEMVERYFYNNR